MKDCYYCEKGEKLNQLMTHIAKIIMETDKNVL